MVSAATVQKRSQIQNDMADVFGTEKGKKVLHHLIKHQGVLAPAHTRGNTCCDTAHQDGRRAVILDILHFINVDPTYFDRIVEEIEREKYNG